MYCYFCGHREEDCPGGIWRGSRKGAEGLCLCCARLADARARPDRAASRPAIAAQSSMALAWCRLMPADNPVVRIEISGIRSSGKSVLAAHFRAYLTELGLTVHGPAGLPVRSPSVLANAIDSLKGRGLFVEFVETNTREVPPIDARYRRPEIAA